MHMLDVPISFLGVLLGVDNRFLSVTNLLMFHVVAVERDRLCQFHGFKLGASHCLLSINQSIQSAI
jgi:hypothetical protein